LYLAYTVTDLTAPQGTNAVSPFLNDSVELFAGGPGAPAGTFRPNDHQWVIDHSGAAKVYNHKQTIPPTTALVTHAVTTGTTYTIEARLDASFLEDGARARSPGRPPSRATESRREPSVCRSRTSWGSTAHAATQAAALLGCALAASLSSSYLPAHPAAAALMRPRCTSICARSTPPEL
jgi:hypothetical protein